MYRSMNGMMVSRMLTWQRHLLLVLNDTVHELEDIIVGIHSRFDVTFLYVLFEYVLKKILKIPIRIPYMNTLPETCDIDCVRNHMVLTPQSGPSVVLVLDQALRIEWVSLNKYRMYEQPEVPKDRLGICFMLVIRNSILDI